MRGLGLLRFLRAVSYRLEWIWAMKLPVYRSVGRSHRYLRIVIVTFAIKSPRAQIFFKIPPIKKKKCLSSIQVLKTILLRQFWGYFQIFRHLSEPIQIFLRSSRYYWTTLDNSRSSQIFTSVFNIIWDCLRYFWTVQYFWTIPYTWRVLDISR